MITKISQTAMKFMMLNLSLSLKIHIPTLGLRMYSLDQDQKF